jgi:hypothetical protein
MEIGESLDQMTERRRYELDVACDHEAGRIGGIDGGDIEKIARFGALSAFIEGFLPA